MKSTHSGLGHFGLGQGRSSERIRYQSYQSGSVWEWNANYRPAVFSLVELEPLDVSSSDASSSSHSRQDESQEGKEDNSQEDNDALQDALVYAFPYLDLVDLLRLELVSKSICTWIRSDTLLWLNLKVGEPLNRRLTDDRLLSLVARSRGYLNSLELINCHLISDAALHQVITSNLKLTRLRLRGCKNLSVPSLVKTMAEYISLGGKRLEQLWIDGLQDASGEHVIYLTGVLQEKWQESMRLMPIHYPGGEPTEDRPMDLEGCPRCLQLRRVYDCTRDECECRGCIVCIPRCKRCGTCLDDIVFEETFTLEFVCILCEPPSENIVRIPRFGGGVAPQQERRIPCHQFAPPHDVRMPPHVFAVGEARQKTHLQH